MSSERISRKRAARRDAILDAAIGVLNGAGASGTTLERVAGELGLVRTAVYYYFKSKQALLLACYQETCDRRDALLDDASSGAASAIERLQHYLRNDLSKTQGPMADLQSVVELGARQRAQIARRRQWQVNAIAELLSAGMADGSIRSCNPAVVAEVLFSLCNLWAAPARSGIAPSLQGQESTALVVEMLIHGVIADGHRQSARWLDADADDQLALPDLASGSGYLQRRDLLLRKALEEFNRHGFEAATLDRIARAVGVTKGMVYHYAASKESLLFQCYDRALRALERAEQAAVTRGGDPLAVMRRVARYSLLIHGSAAGPLPDYSAMTVLDLSTQSFLKVRQWELASHYIARLEQAIAAGYLKDYDPILMATIASATLQGVPRWYQTRNHGGLDSVESDLFRTLTLGLSV